MGWFGSWSGAGDSTNDLYNKLDPHLRDFLEKESPSNQAGGPANSGSTSAPVSQTADAAPSTYRSQLGLNSPGVGLKNQETIPEHRPSVPTESLFQDGRYAHLWKNYRPQTEVEGAGKTDQDRLADVITEYKNRKADIGRAALENCVEYQLAERDCLTNGSLWKKMSMCREESKEFNRCYTMQARFLSALGYLSAQQSAEEQEKIQMHSDKLYHEMLERERVQREAAKQGREEEELPSLIDPEKTMKALGPDSSWARSRQRAIEMGMSTNLSSYTPEKQDEIKKRIEGLPPRERELELQLIAAEARSQMDYAERIAENMETEKRHREERRARGKETIGDTLRRLWDINNGSMSTASSPKHNRNERHLQRQRGAGARNLTTSFGFVLGLPLDLLAQPVTDPSQSIEPPAKRRKVCRGSEKESGHAADHAEVSAAKEESVRELQSTSGSRSRRSFNTLLEEKDVLPKSQTDESFVENRPVVRKRGRPKKACARDEFTLTDTVAVAPGLAPAEVGIGDAPAPLKKRRGRPRKIVSLSPKQEPAPAETRDEFAKTSHILVKKRGRPKKRVATAADNAALDQDSASTESGNPTASYSSIVPPDLQESRAQQLSKSAAPEKLAVRPRRQAATSAMSKMLEVLREEELPVDSKRREATDDSTKKRQRRTAPSGRTSNPLKRSDSSCTNRDDTVGAPMVLKDSERAWQLTVKDKAAPARKQLAAAEVNAMTIEARSSEVLEEECGPKQRRRKQVVLAAGKENGQI
ncbi:hypothetical protein AC578_6007 [Pseudocercospora eumusae]|uniref:Uncharacterized protein n=1 Tax=Pseudocercospora eumusae TaxID=321146 RepID=A0A139HVC4_9PEZI|nr:hypothetical protein AC578_6007 [Pseudocercospora eumusae]